MANIPKGDISKKTIVKARRILKKLGFGKYLPHAAKHRGFYRNFEHEWHMVELVQAHGEIPPYLMQSIRKEYKAFAKRPALNLGLTDTPLTMIEFELAHLPLSGANVHFDKGTEMYEIYAALSDAVKACAAPYLVSQFIAVKRIMVEHSSLTGIGILTEDTEFATHNKYGEVVRVRILIGLRRPQRRKVTLKGHARTVYEVLTCKGKAGETYAMSAQVDGEEMPCYVQGHAYERIVERFDICTPGIAREAAFNSADKATVIPYRRHLLLPVDLEGMRMGYFVCERCADMLVLSTFKLVTHRGTPEGDLFTEEQHLARPDVAALRLDHLSSFTRRALDDDPMVDQILRNSSLSYLATMDLQEVIVPPSLQLKNVDNLKGEPMLLLAL